jgi:hypothetical protein
MPSNNGQIEIPGGQDLVVQEQQVKNVTTITIQRVVCVPQQRVIRAFVRELGRPITIYSGDDYDALNGVITMENVESRVQEELGLSSSS